MESIFNHANIIKDSCCDNTFNSKVLMATSGPKKSALRKSPIIENPTRMLSELCCNLYKSRLIPFHIRFRHNWW